MSQFIYFLRLRPQYQDFTAWTEREHGIVERHFAKLSRLTEEGKVILAGRTLTDDPTGIVVLTVDSEEEARSMMDADPAILEQLMTGELFPFNIALLKGQS